MIKKKHCELSRVMLGTKMTTAGDADGSPYSQESHEVFNLPPHKIKAVMYISNNINIIWH